MAILGRISFGQADIIYSDADPVATDDSSKGIAVGSLMIRNTVGAWLCTSNGVGTATWDQIITVAGTGILPEASVHWNVRAEAGAAPAIAADGDFISYSFAGAVAQTLPAGAAGAKLLLKSANAAAVVTVTPDGAETIDGAATLVLQPLQAALLVWNGTGWDVAAQSHPQGTATYPGVWEGAIAAEVTAATDATRAVTPASMASALNAGHAATHAANATSAGIKVCHHVAVTAGYGAGPTNFDVTIDDKIRVTGVKIVRKDAAGTPAVTCTVQNGANAITNAIVLSGGADKDTYSEDQIDDDYYEIASGGTLRVAVVSGAADGPALDVFVDGVASA